MIILRTRLPLDARAHLRPKSPRSKFLHNIELDPPTHGRNALNEWSARCRGRCLHNT